MRAKTVTLTRREVQQLARTHDNMVRWIRNHEELCEERMELLSLQRSVRAGGKVLDRIEQEVAS